MPDQSSDLFFELRLRFLAEGQQACAVLLQNNPEALDLAVVKKVVHGWAGAGGMLGCPQITVQARIIEQLIRDPFEGSLQCIWDAINTSHQVFSQRISADTSPKTLQAVL